MGNVITFRGYGGPGLHIGVSGTHPHFKSTAVLS